MTRKQWVNFPAKDTTILSKKVVRSRSNSMSESDRYDRYSPSASKMPGRRSRISSSHVGRPALTPGSCALPDCQIGIVAAACFADWRLNALASTTAPPSPRHDAEHPDRHS